MRQLHRPHLYRLFHALRQHALRRFHRRRAGRYRHRRAQPRPLSLPEFLHPLRPAAGNSTLHSRSPLTVPYPADFAITISFTGGGINSGSPLSIAIDAAGNVWSPASSTNLLAEFSPLGTPLLQQALAAEGSGHPTGIAIDNSGNVWIANANSGLSEFSSTGIAKSTGPFGYTGGGLSGGDAVAVDTGGSIWVANNTSYMPGVSKFNSNGTPVTGSPFTGAGIYDSTGIAIDPSNYTWISNSFFESVTKMPNSGSTMGTVSYNSGGISSATTNVGIAIDSGGNVWTTGSNLVAKISSSGVGASGSPFTGGGLSVPQGIAIDGLGNAWIINRYTGLSTFSNSGTALSPAAILGTGLGGNYALAIDISGNIWVANTSGSCSIVEFIGIAAPVVTPIAAAVMNNTLGKRRDIPVLTLRCASNTDTANVPGSFAGYRMPTACGRRTAKPSLFWQDRGTIDRLPLWLLEVSDAFASPLCRFVRTSSGSSSKSCAALKPSTCPAWARMTRSSGNSCATRARMPTSGPPSASRPIGNCRVSDLRIWPTRSRGRLAANPWNLQTDLYDACDLAEQDHVPLTLKA